MASDDLYRALLGRLEGDATRWHRGDRLRRDVDQTRTALRAVVELHAPREQRSGLPDAALLWIDCAGCDDGAPGAAGGPDWPCSTIRTIAEHLGVQQDQKNHRGDGR